MTSAQVVDLKGKKVGDLELAKEVFAIEPNMGVLHSALVRQLANGRSGSANTKTRSEVRGGGRKPWRQKGTGRARAGSIRSPLWAGGGVAFGPKPRDYSIAMPKKQRVLALKSALAAKREALVVVKDFDSFSEAKTKQFATILKDLGLAEKKVLVILDYACDACKRVERAARNIEGVVVIRSSNLNVKDLLHADAILTNNRTLDAITDRFKTVREENGASEKPAKVKKTAEKAASSEAKAEKAPAKEKKDAAPKKEAAPKKAAAPKEEGAKKTTKSTKKDA